MSLLDRIAKQKEYDAAHPEEAKKRKEEAERRRAEEHAKREAERLEKEKLLAEEKRLKEAKLKDVKKSVTTESKPVKASKSKLITKPVKAEVEVEPLLTEKQGIYKYISDLLVDKTTGENIIFAEDEYEGHKPEEHYTEEVMKELIASKKLNYRVRKSQEQQKERTKKKAEVFTPSWICKDMIDMCQLPKNWEDLVQSTVLEITCGEAPFIVSRYDATTGDLIPIEERIGVLDRKMQAINKNVNDKAEWTRWTYRAFKCTYGYEWQGDNLFIARVNVLRCFVDNYYYKWKEMPEKKRIEQMIDIITWNFWQMDGLKDTIPLTDIPAKIVDWKQPSNSPDRIIEFRSLKGDN